MSISQQENNQKILDEITHVQAELEAALKHVLEQAGSKLKLEGREEFNKKIQDTKQLLENLKSKYGT